jgi:hypothetical protein
VRIPAIFRKLKKGNTSTPRGSPQMWGPPLFARGITRRHPQPLLPEWFREKEVVEI